MKEVVITGFGVISPLGNDATSTWQSMLAGKSGITPLGEDWPDDVPVNFAGQVDVDVNEYIPRVEARRMDRVSQLAVIAAQEAWFGAGFTDHDVYADLDRLAVCVGTGIGGLITTLEQWDVMHERGPRRVSPFTVPMLMANAPAAHVGLKIGAKAGVHSPVSACASSNEAISLGLNLLQLDHADMAIVGGAEATLHPMPVVSFSQMQALSRRNDDPAAASRPWDQDRDGFVLSEGAAMMVIETLESAQARGATIYGTLAGAGVTADAHDLVQPDPSGDGQYKAMVKAMDRAGVSPAEISHVNAHGTSTPQGDATEAKSIRRALGDQADTAIVTSTKSMTGHLLGAAGALETFATAMALRDKIVPPTINLDNPDEDLPINVAANQTVALPDGDLAALNNSFGFGGHNVCVVLTNKHVTQK